MLLTKNAKEIERSESNGRCIEIKDAYGYFDSLVSVAINVMNPFCCGTTQGTMAECATVAVTDILTEK